MAEHRDELYESIPWDALVADDAQRRRRWLYLAAAAIVIGALSAAIGRSVPAPEEPMPVATTTTVQTLEQAPPSTAPLVEADLRPADVEDVREMAAGVAVWFLSDYFTIDGSDVTGAAVVALLPEHVSLPAPDPVVRSFVETVIPVSVEPLDSGRYRVVAIVRALQAPDGRTYLRQPARAVELFVQATAEGVGVVDLPRPVALPAVEVTTAEPVSGEIPTEVATAAREQAALWGTVDPEPVAVGSVGEVWRVLTSVTDDAGVSWPVVGWFDANGAAVDPP
jgi:hypothetical protein